MILCYDNFGRVNLTYNDPIPNGIDAVLMEHGISFVHHKPVNGDIYGARVAHDVYVMNGEVLPRPDFAIAVNVTDRIVSLAGVPDGSTVLAIIDPGTPFEHREIINEYTIEFDEPSKVSFVINPPFPMKERSIDVEIQ